MLLPAELADLLLAQNVPQLNRIITVGAEEQAATLGEFHTLHRLKAVVIQLSDLSNGSQVPNLYRGVFVANGKCVDVLRHEPDRGNTALVLFEGAEAGSLLADVPDLEC